MRTSSVFCSECLCGVCLENPTLEFVCLARGRVFVFEWNAVTEAVPAEAADTRDPVPEITA